MKLDTYIFQQRFHMAAYRGKSIRGRCRKNARAKKKKKKREREKKGEKKKRGKRKRRKLESFISGKGAVCVFGRIESTMLVDTAARYLSHTFRLKGTRVRPFVIALMRADANDQDAIRCLAIMLAAHHDLADAIRSSPRFLIAISAAL